MSILYLLFLCVLYASANPFHNKSPVSGRIVGGAVARAGQFPFIASIYITRSDGRYFCSGALIKVNWVLTAGQCVDGATLFTIHLGSNSPGGNDNTSVTLATDTYVLHPDYNPVTLENDVGLIKFRSWVSLSDYIQPLNMLSATTLPDYAVVATMGWGQTSDDTAGPVDQLYYVYLTTLSNRECQLTFGSQITDGMVCAGGSYNQGTCVGDSGSPLIQYTAAHAAYHVGISSFLSANGCESPEPSGFTRTHYYVDWINNVTLNS